MKNVQAPKGTRDVGPQEGYEWQWIEQQMREVSALHGYAEVRTPVFEHTELFLRGVGDTTDVVQKEMYTFEDKGGRSVTLKPEGTAGVVRMLIEHKLYTETMPLKLYYVTCPNFRYERPQSGRLREFHQYGLECFGSHAPSADAELILAFAELVRRFGIQGARLHINSIGCPKCRPVYQQALREFLAAKLPALCATCNDRFERNPMRILDCKVPDCQAQLDGVPHMLDYLCEECAEHFAGLKALLDSAGQPYIVDPAIVRGLDYYTKTVFEFISETPDGALTIGAGGRYDGLVEELGGPALPGVGFGMGMERILMMMRAQSGLPEAPPRVQALVTTLGDRQRPEAFQLVLQLRAAGIASDLDHNARSLKAQMKYAGKLGAPVVVMLGEEESARGAVVLRNMQAGEQLEVPLDGLIAAVRDALSVES